MIPNYLSTIQNTIDSLKLTHKARNLFDPQTNEQVHPYTYNFLVHYLNALGYNDLYIILDLNPDLIYADLYIPDTENPALKAPKEFQPYNIEIIFSPTPTIHLLLSKD